MVVLCAVKMSTTFKVPEAVVAPLIVRLAVLIQVLVTPSERTLLFSIQALPSQRRVVLVAVPNTVSAVVESRVQAPEAPPSQT